MQKAISFFISVCMRRTRHLQEGARYHVIARANRRELILNSPEIKQLFIDIVKRAKEKYRFSVINFCIMGNHVHFIIQPLKGESISRIMQWILSVFAIRFNKIFNYIGHVWHDRFKSFILWSLNQFLRTFLYIAENPVKAGLARNADDFPYNGIWFLKRGIFTVLEPPDVVLKLMLPAFFIGCIGTSSLSVNCGY
jgi:REP element-mobilizing transposase RayT